MLNIGEFRIDGQGLTLAIIDGYQGDINLQYICLLTHSASVYHNGKIRLIGTGKLFPNFFFFF